MDGKGFDICEMGMSLPGVWRMDWVWLEGGVYLLQLLITAVRLSIFCCYGSGLRRTSPGGAPSTKDATAAMAADDILHFLPGFYYLL